MHTIKTAAHRLRLEFAIAAAAVFAVALFAHLGSGVTSAQTDYGTTTSTSTMTQSVPAAPTDLSLASTPTSGSVALRWTDNASNEDKFHIERKAAYSATYASLVLLSGQDIVSYVDTSVVPGTLYDYRVRACLTDVGCSQPSTLPAVLVPPLPTSGTESSTTTTGTGNTSTSTGTAQSPSVPAAPTELRLDAPAQPTAVYLKWRDNATNEDKFNIERRASGSSTFTFVQQLVGANIGQFIDTTVSPGTTYEYRVQACLSGAGCSSYAYLSGVTTPTTSTAAATTTNTTVSGTAPHAPAGLTAVPACYSVSLSWGTVTGASGYKVIRNGTLIKTTSNPAYADSGLSMGTTYRYEVRAVNSYGVSSAAAVETRTTTACSTATAATSTTTTTATSGPTTAVQPAVPAAPTELALDAPPTTTYVKLRWRDNASNEDKFVIERRPSGATAFAPLTQISQANLDRFADYSVAAGASYDYRVRACLTGVGCSAYAYLTGVRTPTAPVTTTGTTATTAPKTETTTMLPVKTSTTSQTQIAPFATATTAPKTAELQTAATAYKIQSVSETLGAAQDAVDAARAKLIAVIDDNVARAAAASNLATSSEVLLKVRADLVSKIDSYLDGYYATTTASVDVSGFSKIIAEGLRRIYEAANAERSAPTSMTDVSAALGELSGRLEAESKALSSAGGDLMFKDSNDDGISDFESVHVYGIDPVKPSPVSRMGDRTVKAGEKVLLGYDPKSESLVEVVPEEPAKAKAPVVTVMKVKDVRLTDEKKLVVAGRALPNSIVTIYIYSTPVIVRVKADANGEWTYVLDKELESGEHSIYMASVNNTGKIVAKSGQFSFTKTAEAATLNSMPSAVGMPKEPRMFGDVPLGVLATVAALIVVGTLLVIGMWTRRKDDLDPGAPTGTPTAPQA